MTRPNPQLLLDQRCGTLNHLREIHAQGITQGLIPGLQRFTCKLLNTYGRLGDTTSAERLFHEIPNPDIISWTSLISLHVQSGTPHLAAPVFRDLLLSGLKLDGFATVGALTAASRTRNLVLGKSLHGMVWRHRLSHETTVSNALITCYCVNGKFEQARKVFDRMEKRDAVSWSSMLHGCAKCEGLEHARRLFDEMPRSFRNAVCWTVMVTAYVQGGCSIRAIELFRRMKSEGERPTLVTVAGVLSACADLGALDFGISVHGFLCKAFDHLDTALGNCLMDMYVKGGRLDVACRIFDSMTEKDIYTWTTMISGFAIHGRGREALEMFEGMMQSGMSPNPVTFVSLLLACSHSGLVLQGRRWFHVMRERCRFEPGIEHYGCMVDLLSRAGLLKEAHELVEKMGTTPDVAIWRSMLSASLVHGDTEMAELSGKRIMELEPDDDGVYVLLWNMYSRSGRWGEALRIKNMMRSRSVVKQPGCSWVELNGDVHEFLVEDRRHGLSDELYALLENMETSFKQPSVIGEDVYVAD